MVLLIIRKESVTNVNRLVCQGQSLEHVREFMGTSMESLIHHFKLVTQGFRVPAGQVFQTVEHAKSTLGSLSVLVIFLHRSSAI